MTARDGDLTPVVIPRLRTPLTKPQKEFNRRTARVEELRREVARWKAFTEDVDAVLARDLEPLRRQLGARRMALLRLLDEAHDGDALTKRERTRLAAVIVDVACDLLDLVDEPDAIAIHDKHSRVSWEHRAVDPGHEEEREPGSPEAPAEAPGQGEEDGDAARRRPRSVQALARQARAKAAAEGAQLSLREVYRKLASALHPDREPDPEERQRKTTLMQDANRMVAACDLLGLLTLQMQVEQFDPARLAELGDTRLAHYNRVLKEQAESLDRELAALTAPFGTEVRGPHRRAKASTPETVLREIQDDVAAFRRELRYTSQDLEVFRDVRYLKAWLQSMRVSRAAD